MDTYFIYDGECPMCSNAALAYRLREKFGALNLVNARELDSNNHLMHEINARGLDLDEGMVIVHDGRYYHGKDALKFMAKHAASKDAFNVFLKSLFWSDWVCRVSYPFMRGTRNWLLRRKNIGRINNLNLKKELISKCGFKLLLPALIPSWRFFDVIAPSPRIEIKLTRNGIDAAENWQEFRPRPQKRSLPEMLKGMIWNPRWNESLFLMSCAERLAQDDEVFACQEIFRRIKRDLSGEGFIQFRLTFHSREDGQMIKHIAYLSPLEPFGSEAAK